jgi:hypothetical protein
MITYKFTDDSAGICQVFREEGYKLNLSDGSNLGLWVYGDYSFNRLEIWYDSSFLQNQVMIIDTLDFSGWKLIKIPGTFFEDPNINLHSIVITQLPSGYAQGKIYIDDLQTDIITDLTRVKEPLTAAHFQLYQNYPNPFNPLTFIRYQIPKASLVKLDIYNMLGQKIETLVNKKQAAGEYQVIFNAKNLASGIYFYTLKTQSGFRQSRKFLLVK